MPRPARGVGQVLFVWPLAGLGGQSWSDALFVFGDAMSDEILERLKRLEDENRRLQSLLVAKPAVPVAAIKPTKTYVDLWQGKPILRFDGPFKPFGIGWKKASVILECFDALKFFVENNKGASDDGETDPS